MSIDRRKLSFRQQTFTYLRAFLGGCSVTCNKDALTGREVEALEYLESEGVCFRTYPENTSGVFIDCPRCLGKGRTIDDVAGMEASKKSTKKAKCFQCKGTGKFREEMDPNDASGRFRFNPERKDKAHHLMRLFDKEIKDARKMIARGN